VDEGRKRLLSDVEFGSSNGPYGSSVPVGDSDAAVRLRIVVMVDRRARTTAVAINDFLALPSMTMDHLPLIDLRAAPDEVAKAIGEACRQGLIVQVDGQYCLPL